MKILTPLNILLGSAIILMGAYLIPKLITAGILQAKRQFNLHYPKEDTHGIKRCNEKEERRTEG